MVRKYLHRKGVFTGITVVYSPEPISKKAVQEVSGEENKRSVVGTISYMPPVFGCFCASVVIRQIISV
jgi:tRNA A37 threonylcarbamoyladenosine dehydratase